MYLTRTIDHHFDGVTSAANLYGADDPFPVPVTGNDNRDAYLNSGNGTES